MSMLAIIVAILIGAPILCAICVLLALVPFFLLGLVGLAASKFGGSNTSSKSSSESRDSMSDFPPGIRFRIRNGTPLYGRNARAM